jgi:flagellar motility protein MotE (MotC chaperone)
MDYKMKVIILVILLITSVSALATDKNVFTQNEFDTKVRDEVKKQIDIIKKKSITELTKEVIDKEFAVVQRQKTIQQREDILEANRKRLLTQIQSFEKQQNKVIGCISDNENKAAKRLNKIVSVVSNMKPVKASQLLSVQESSISVQILAKLDPVKASKIFNLMGKEISARLQKQYLDMKK